MLRLERGARRDTQPQGAAVALAARKVEPLGPEFPRHSAPTTVSHCVTSWAAAKPRLPRTGPATFATSPAKARMQPRRFSTPTSVRDPKACARLCCMAFAKFRHSAHERRTGHAEGRNDRNRSRRIAARLVRPAPPRPAVARAAWRAARSLSRLAQRGDAAADDGRCRHAVFRCVPGALARCRRAGGGVTRRGAACVAGLRLLRPRAQSPCLRPRRGGHGRRLSRYRSGAARAARDRRLHGGGDRRDRLRPQRRARSTAMSSA